MCFKRNVRLFQLINAIFVVWIIINIIGGLSVNYRDYEYREILFILMCVTVSIYFLYCIFKNKYRNCIDYYLERVKWKNKIILLSFLTLLLLIWQVYFVIFASTGIGFDVGIVASTVSHHNDMSWWFKENYFSFYPNNLFLLYIEYTWHLAFGSTWHSLSFLSLFCVDLFMIITIVTSFVMSKKIVITTWIFLLAWLSFFPYIIVPYTDTLVLPLISAYILFYVLLRKAELYWLKVVFSLIIGITLMLSFFMKPTAVIPMIAILFVELTTYVPSVFHVTYSKQHILKIAIILVAGISSMFVTNHIYTNAVNNQKYVRVDKNMKIPPVHFIAMGMHGNGGFDKEDAAKMYSSHSTAEMIKISNKTIIKNVEKYSLFQYFLFLIQKNKNNTSDGSFGWLEEGGFISEKPKNIIQQWIYPKGKYVNYFYAISQIIWIIMLVNLVLVNTKNTDLYRYENVFKIAVLGGLTYLLIFEGGRSRYMIQFMPVIILLLGMSKYRYAMKHL